MRVSILKFVFFSIIIYSFEYAKNELYFVNERDTCLERNITNFRNNRILADVNNQFNINDFHQSTLRRVSQFNDYNDDDDDEEMIFLRNIIDSQIKKHKENNTLPNLNNVDKKTKKLINGLLTEIEEVKKELDNKRNSEMAIQPIQDKRITKKDENNYVSEHENFKQLENYENNYVSEHENFKQLENYENNSVSEHENFRQLENFEKNMENKDYKFYGKFVKVISNNYKKLKVNKNIKKNDEKTLKRLMMAAGAILFVAIASGTVQFLLLLVPFGFLISKKWWKIVKNRFNE
ncbi:fam-b protein [Plasmodium yoelii]|uniref:Fam-b protein n=2 Tax=Plasmodium yoelii TaxID=5861 RepID=A0AAF0B6R1_PLAYO|nr:fam-b protein [Plasmodium yoelii]WBY59654.1 fam-b protein [Plasmodium yoelii yoelii]VTZ80393.1 fam-b protein [Plasmodium yoelii]|eukprot:XP_022813457.1 fam-b protein [Plasmodium yoelii]